MAPLRSCSVQKLILRALLSVRLSTFLHIEQWHSCSNTCASISIGNINETIKSKIYIWPTFSSANPLNHILVLLFQSVSRRLIFECFDICAYINIIILGVCISSIMMSFLFIIDSIFNVLFLKIWRSKIPLCSLMLRQYSTHFF